MLVKQLSLQELTVSQLLEILDSANIIHWVQDTEEYELHALRFFVLEYDGSIAFEEANNYYTDSIADELECNEALVEACLTEDGNYSTEKEISLKQLFRLSNAFKPLLDAIQDSIGTIEDTL